MVRDDLQGLHAQVTTFLAETSGDPTVAIHPLPRSRNGGNRLVSRVGEVTTNAGCICEFLYIVLQDRFSSIIIWYEGLGLLVIGCVFV